MPRAGVIRPFFVRRVPSTHQGRFSEQAFDQIDRQLAGAVVVVERRVELHDVQRRETAGIGDHLHH